MLTAVKEVEIFCTESMLDIVPMALDGPVAMEDVKTSEEQTEAPVKQKRLASPFLTLVTRLGTELKLTNQLYRVENCLESM